MNWIEIIKLFMFLWPHIEKILKGIEDTQERDEQKEKAIAAIVLMANKKTYT